MSYLATGLDLKRDALFLAGEPTDGTSEYDSRVYEWLTVVQNSLISGGQFGPSILQPQDWPWARAYPRGAIQLVQPYNQTTGFSAAFTTNSSNVIVNTLSPTTLLPNLENYRIFRQDTSARHIINRVFNQFNNSKTIELREPWTGETITDANWFAYPDTYALPDNFVRGTSPLFMCANPATQPGWLGSPIVIDLIDPGDMERMYPQSWTFDGTGTTALPILAARVSQDRIRFSHFLNTPASPLPVQLEFEYIARPEIIAEGVIPKVPIEHRRVLSYGAAYLILDDKDDSGAQSLWGKFQAQYQALLQEYTRDLRRMSSRWGKIQPSRLSGYGTIVGLTESGLPVFWW